MPPFSLPAFRLRGWGWGLSLLGIDPGRWPGCFPVRAVWAAWAAFFSRWGVPRWMASAADKGGFPLIRYILILRRFLGVLFKVV